MLSGINTILLLGISEEIKKWNADALELFHCLIESPHTVDSKVKVVNKRLQEITTLIHRLSKESESSGDLGMTIENELAGMDKAIEAAAAKIEVSAIIYFIFISRIVKIWKCLFLLIKGNVVSIARIRFRCET